MTFIEIATLIVDAEGVEDAIVQQTVTRDDIPRAREPGSDAWQRDRPLRADYRVFVRGPKKHCEATDASLSNAIRAAFKGAGVPMPKGLKL